MNVSPERLARIQSLCQNLDEHTAHRIFQAFALFRDIPATQRDTIAERCCALMRQQKIKAEEDAVRFRKLQAQLEKARNEIRQFFIELPDNTFERLFDGVEVFRQLTAVQKHDAAAELFHFLETLKPKSPPERPHHD